MRINRYVLGMIMTNTYLVWDEVDGKCFIVDFSRQTAITCNSGINLAYKFIIPAWSKVIIERIGKSITFIIKIDICAPDFNITCLFWKNEICGISINIKS